MSSAAGSRLLHAGLREDVSKQSALQIYPELRHEIFQEPEREQVWADILDWLDRGSAEERRGT